MKLTRYPNGAPQNSPCGTAERRPISSDQDFCRYWMKRRPLPGQFFRFINRMDGRLAKQNLITRKVQIDSITV